MDRDRDNETTPSNAERYAALRDYWGKWREQAAAKGWTPEPTPPAEMGTASLIVDMRRWAEDRWWVDDETQEVRAVLRAAAERLERVTLRPETHVYDLSTEELIEMVKAVADRLRTVNAEAEALRDRLHRLVDWAEETGILGPDREERVP